MLLSTITNLTISLEIKSKECDEYKMQLQALQSAPLENSENLKNYLRIANEKIQDKRVILEAAYANITVLQNQLEDSQEGDEQEEYQYIVEPS